MDTYIIGGDTETLRGQPMTMQFYSPELGMEDMVWCEGKGLRPFTRWVRSLPTKAQCVMYVHFLEFDMIEFLYELRKELARDEFDFNYDSFRFSGVFGGPNFFRCVGRDRSLLVVDSWSYYRGSLDQAAALYCPELPKLRRPNSLGSKSFGPRDTEFCEYAMRDSIIAYRIGCSIQKLVEEYDVPQPVSVADFAGKVFRRRFVQTTIHQPPLDCIHASLKAYHGGVNRWNKKPGWHIGVHSSDIKSAYPFAGTMLPAFSSPKLFRQVRLKPRSSRDLNLCGVYCISGQAPDSTSYPALFDHGFKPLAGEFQRVWVHGFELARALDASLVKLSGAVLGWIYEWERDSVPSPFAAYFETFYKAKESQTDKIRKEQDKFTLNSLTGKLIQTKKGPAVTTIDADTGEITTAADLEAGGLCHPFAAAFITAHTRASINIYEPRLDAIHTATDGLFHRLRGAHKKTKELGGLNYEGSGDLLMFRNKLYVFYAPEGSEEGFPSKTFAGRRILKFAKHGFQGSVYELEAMAATGRRSYEVTGPTKLKTSLRTGLQVNDFVPRSMQLRVPRF